MIQSIDRAARVLFQLQGARRLGIGELAAALGLPPSTVHGIVASLAEHGLVAKESGTNRYVLGPALLRLSNVYLDTLEVRAHALRWSAELSRRTGFATRLAVPFGDDVIVILHHPRPGRFEHMPEQGAALPAHACALGKVLLAHDSEFAGSALARPLAALTGETRTDATRLRVELAQVAARGLAHEEDEAVIGESGLAAPVFDRTGAVVAALGVVVPTSEYPPGEFAVDDLREAARSISRELGASSWPPFSA